MNDSLSLIVSVIAKKYGVSEEEVLQEMQSAINAGKASGDPEVQAVWGKIPDSGDSTADAIAYVSFRLLEIRQD